VDDATRVVMPGSGVGAVMLFHEAADFSAGPLGRNDAFAGRLADNLDGIDQQQFGCAGVAAAVGCTESPHGFFNFGASGAVARCFFCSLFDAFES